MDIRYQQIQYLIGDKKLKDYDREVTFAIKEQILIFYNIKSLKKYYSKCNLKKQK